MKSILIIEDELSLQKIYKTKLTDAGFEVIQAYTGEEGIKLAQKDIPDLIILDIMLPGGPDGFFLLTQLKHNAITKNIPVIVATNIDDQIAKALDTGATWYFVKAHTPIEAVVDKIKAILA